MTPSLEQPRTRMNPLIPYLGGVGAWFAFMGLQFVMIPTLVLIVLGGSAGDLAFAQIAMSLPQLFLLIYAGGVADRHNGRTMLVLVHIVATIPVTALCWLVWSNQLVYAHIIIFALGMGMVSAFSAPPRDAMLTRVATGNVQNAVMMSLVTQFSAQLIGFALAGLAAPIAGPWALLAMQAFAMVFGLVCAVSLPSIPPIAHDPNDATAIPDRGWLTGHHVVSQSQRIYPVMLATIAVGIFFIGIFMVSLPLIVRNIFGGGQLEISIMNFCFWGGTILSTLILLFRRPIHHRGLAMSSALIVGSVTLLIVPFARDFVVLCILAHLWGLAAGVNMVTSRTIVQIEAPAKARARVLAFYNLGFLGAAPLGAFFAGISTELIGPLTTTGLFAALMLAFTIWLLTFTPVVSIVRHEDE